ncbi:TPA: amidophosphoribosyltransferase [Candidatus Poribacteria bacterium]|nr:amidophosphoribosyltransferase [Candidatus Poribacteria bacterium]
MSGIFGVVSKKDCVTDLFHGTDYHSHMGAERAGLVVLSDRFKQEIHRIGSEQFRGKFVHTLSELKGNQGIGVITGVRESQPLIVGSKMGNFAIVLLGMITNADEVAKMLQENGHVFSEMSDGKINSVEVAAKIIAQGKDYVTGINDLFDQIKGSASVLILDQNGTIYAGRDKYGRTPLAIGVRDDSIAVASETCAFANLGYNTVKFLQPGEIDVISKDGFSVVKEGNPDNLQVCAFLWIYTSFPASCVDGIDVELVRERCGRALARRDDVDADYASGVPDSGVGHGLGYAAEKGIPFRRPLVKYTPSYGRSYTPVSQQERDYIARMKLIAIEDIIKNQRIVICEDSIVRGTQLKNETVKKLWGANAKELHIRPACPPLMFPCVYLSSTRSINELAARRAIFALEGRNIDDVSEYIDHNSTKYQQMVEWIRNDLGVTTLRYQLLDDMVEAIGLPKDRVCLYCWRGY